MNVIKSTDTIYQLGKKFPQIVPILKEIGFTQIVDPAMMSSVGRFMTLEKGCSMRGFNLKEVIEQLERAGFSWEDAHE